MAEKHFDPKDHLANERTFLAWIRTNLGIMAFGFVIERFSLFSRQIASFLGDSDASSQNYSSLPGLALIGIGSILCVFAFLKFKKTEKQIDSGLYQHPKLLNTLLALFVFCIGIFLIIYIT